MQSDELKSITSCSCALRARFCFWFFSCPVHILSLLSEAAKEAEATGAEEAEATHTTEATHTGQEAEATQIAEAEATQIPEATHIAARSAFCAAASSAYIASPSRFIDGPCSLSNRINAS